MFDECDSLISGFFQMSWREQILDSGNVRASVTETVSLPARMILSNIDQDMFETVLEAAWCGDRTYFAILRRSLFDCSQENTDEIYEFSLSYERENGKSVES